MIQLARNKPEGGYSNWSQERIGKEVGISQSYSSLLNQVEIWFNILTKDVLKNAVWKSKEQLINQLMEYIKTYNNERAKPFNWTYKGI